MKTLLVVVLLIVLSGCDVDPVSQSNTNNKEIQVDLLFTHDGCNVYRFNDGGNNHYFVKCRDATTQATISDIPKRPQEYIQTN